MATSKKFRQRVFGTLMPMQELLFNEVHGDRKRVLFESLHGTVMELGPGCGANFGFYPKDKFIHWTGVESNPFVIDQLKAAAARNGFPPATLEIRIADMKENLKNVQDESLDAVVCSQVLCVADQPEEIINQVVRVLRPGGRFYFIEHVARTESLVMGFAQRLVNPFRSLLTDGCSLYNTKAEIIFEDANFSQVYMESWPKSRAKDDSRTGIQAVQYDPETKQVTGLSGLRPIVAGVAVKRSRNILPASGFNPFKGMLPT